MDLASCLPLVSRGQTAAARPQPGSPIAIRPPPARALDVTGNPIVCTVCGASTDDFGGLAGHFIGQADGSDIAHVMWLNRHVTKFEVDAATLAEMLRRHWEGRPTGGDRVAR